MEWNKSKDVLALIVGHGKSLDGTWDPGCTYGNNTEAALMLPIVKWAAKWLRKSGVKVITDADTKNDKNMKASVAMANQKGADLYISVHCDYSGATSGIMFYYGDKTDKKCGDTIAKYLAKKLSMKNKGGKKDLAKFEINSPRPPSIILETGCIKTNQQKLKAYKVYGKALAMAICKYIGVPIYVSNRTRLCRKALELIAYMNAHHFKYNHSYAVCGTSWKRAKKTHRCNCHLLWNFALQELGFLKPGQIFWINGTKIVCKGKGTKAKVKKIFKITHPKKSPAKLKLKKGAICGYSNAAHTQGFYSMKSKKAYWVSWGPSDVGKKQPRHRAKVYDTKPIATVMNLK